LGHEGELFSGGYFFIINIFTLKTPLFFFKKNM